MLALYLKFVVPDPCAGIGGCLAIWCEGQYTPPGECCPVCPCYYKGSVYKSGDHFMDDCNNCTCGFSGDVACTEKACGGSGR
ncbi:hypothetical protein DPMN_188872 [Dreissena polymorpha]|uniref:Pacifastin domain-containing protein n=1 Tax=Dreissena polymorpha TaxID=45954 RepID=A0A9D4IBR6_DREPO|nr:hypothetical protein DPMN_188872 [Dreissena polymorpha]